MPGAALQTPSSFTDWLTDINKEDVSKEDIKEAVFFHNYKEMKESINEYEKLEDIKHEYIRVLPDYMKEKGI